MTNVFQLFSMLSMPLDCELWLSVSWSNLPSGKISSYCRADTGAEKKELCLKLGAEKWVDFRESKDLVKDIKDAAGGDGPHAALVSAANVSLYV